MGGHNDQLTAVVERVAAAMIAAHPQLPPEQVRVVVEHAAAELAGRPPADFGAMLHRRVDARLNAQVGIWMPIRSGGTHQPA